MPTPVEVKALDSYRIWVRFSDSVEGEADLSEYAGKGVFARWNDYRRFQAVHIGPGGEIAWDDAIDMCPDAIYLKITGKRPEDLFPKLQGLAKHGR